MEYTIFYSWQSDSDRSTNRDFIRAALDQAAARIREGANVEFFPRVDAGMENTSGSPEVATIMLQKIRDSAIFVGDLTLVGTITPKGRGAAKRVPNPNVALEIGYAFGRIGFERVITVMNTAKGRPEELPIDFRNKRFPISYQLQPDQKDADAVRARLAEELAAAIQAVVDVEYEAVNQCIRRLDVNCFSLMLKYADHVSFYEEAPGSRSFGGVLDTDRFTHAVSRLLDLNLIEVRPDPKNGALHYGYFWTYLGVKVLVKLNFRVPPTGKDAGHS